MCNAEARPEVLVGFLVSGRRFTAKSGARELGGQRGDGPARQFRLSVSAELALRFETGRFTQEDPIGLAGGMNLYGFASGDPVNMNDPFGLSACPVDVGGDGKTQSVDDCSQSVQNAWADKHLHDTSKNGKDWDSVDPALRSAIVRTSMEFRMDFGISAGQEGGHSVEGRHGVGGAADISQPNGIKFGAMTDAAAVSVGNAVGGAIANRLPYGRNLLIYAPGMAFRLNRPMNANQYEDLLVAHRNHVHASIAP